MGSVVETKGHSKWQESVVMVSISPDGQPSCALLQSMERGGEQSTLPLGTCSSSGKDGKRGATDWRYSSKQTGGSE